MDVVIVCGAPASGKTRYVKENMQLGDFVVDLDAIRAAVSFYDGKMPLNNLTATIFDIRDYIYALIEQSAIDAPRCWVIAGLPKKADRDRLAARLKAKVVFLNTTEDECVRRAIADDTRTDKNFQIKIITEYFTTTQKSRRAKAATKRLHAIRRHYTKRLTTKKAGRIFAPRFYYACDKIIISTP